MSDQRPLPRRALRSLLRGGLVYFGLFVVVHAILAAGSDVWSLLDVVLLLLVAAPQLVLVLRRIRVSSALVTAICATLVVASALGVTSLPPGAGGTSYAAWFLGAITFDLLGLAIVGRYGAAWITMLIIVGVAVAWASATGQGAVVGLGLVVRHAATLLVGTALAVSLRRSTAAFDVSRAIERVQRAEEGAAQASSEARRAAVQRVLDRVGPTLTAIAEGRALSAEDRSELLVLEGALRDDIRSPSLVVGRLRDSVDAARRRGVNVLLMDEAPPGQRDHREAAAGWLADRLDEVMSGGFVGRLRELDGSLRASAVSGGAGRAATFGDD